MNKHIKYVCILWLFCYGKQGFSQGGNFVWAKQMGGSSWDDNGRSIAVDASGNSYITGWFDSMADFDPGAGVCTLTPNGNYDVYVCKLDPSGNFLWAKSFGGSGADYGNSISIDANGNAYITGQFFNTVDFDPGVGTYTLAAGTNANVFISKLDAIGNFVWAKTIGGPSGSYAYSILANSTGLYITGLFNGPSPADFDPDGGTYNLTASWTAGDIFVGKFDYNGALVWARAMGGSAVYSQGVSIAVDPSGNVLTTGSFKSGGIADFDPGPGTYTLLSNGDYDCFISKLDANGNFAWAKNIGGIGGDGGNAITVDSDENVYTLGSFINVVDFDPGVGTYTLSSIGASDAFISKLDPAGNFVWVKNIGGNADDGGVYFKLDAMKNIYVTGMFQSTIDIDPGPNVFNLISNGNYDIFISKLDAFGNLVWGKSIGGQYSDFCRSLDIDANDNLYITGYFPSTVDFDPGPATHNLTSTGGADIFVLKLSETITGQYSESFITKECMVYPNPARDKIYLQGVDENSKNNLMLLNVLGQVVILKSNVQKNEAIDLSFLSKGFYTAILQNEKGSHSFKIVKE